MITLKAKFSIGSIGTQQIDTKIELPKEMEYYYLPTDYREPLRVKLVDYNLHQGIENIIRVMACVDIGDLRLEEVSPNLLFKNKDEASNYYLEHKKELNWDYLFKSEVE